jgi:hypothetical protein
MPKLFKSKLQVLIAAAKFYVCIIIRPWYTPKTTTTTLLLWFEVQEPVTRVLTSALVERWFLETGP